MSLSLRYEGYFNDSITGQLTALMESALLENHLDYRSRTRLKALLVEQVQNVQRYSLERRQGTVEVGQEDGRLFVETVNLIDAATHDELTARLRELDGADTAALQKRFRAAMRAPWDEDERGGGLGLLFLAKQASRLEHHFVTCDHELCFQLKSYL